MGNIEAIESLINDNLARHSPDTGYILTTFIGDYYISLVEDDDTEAYIKAVRTFLDKIKINYKIGVGQSTNSIDYIAVSYHESIEAIQKNPDNTDDFHQNINEEDVENSKLLLLHKHIYEILEYFDFQTNYRQ
jgi:GTP cyclohydrolase III